MNVLIGPEPLLYPSLSPSVLDFVRIAYGILLVATLFGTLPHAKRFFLSERWGGYAQRGPWVDPIQNPIVLPLLLVVWLVSGAALILGRSIVPAALINFFLSRYFFIQMRWRGVLRGMGAPGFITYWLAAALLLLEYTRRFAPELAGLALLVLQVDFALIMLSAGMYKFSAGYHENNGMELGLVNPQWGYWPHVWSRSRPAGWWFRTFNELAWGTEVLAALLMLFPPTRFLGGMLILISFIFIATQIRLGFLCEMIIVCCLIFAYPGSMVDRWVTSALPGLPAPAGPAPPVVNTLLGVGLWAYLALLPFARLGLSYNFHAKKALPGILQRVFELYTNFFGLILWRVFSADITNFFVRIYEQDSDGSRRLISCWGRTLRYVQVAESIAVTSLFTTLKYYPSNNQLFVDRLLRYSRTIPRGSDAVLVFQYVSILKRDAHFDFVPVAEYVVDTSLGTVAEHVLDNSVSVRAAAERSPIHEGARPGSYVPLAR